VVWEFRAPKSDKTLALALVYYRGRQGFVGNQTIQIKSVDLVQTEH
jgi:hypothetical protein